MIGRKTNYTGKVLIGTRGGDRVHSQREICSLTATCRRHTFCFSQITNKRLDDFFLGNYQFIENIYKFV